jgi:hypothetical protein
MSSTPLNPLIVARLRKHWMSPEVDLEELLLNLEEWRHILGPGPELPKCDYCYKNLSFDWTLCYNCPSVLCNKCYQCLRCEEGERSDGCRECGFSCGADVCRHCR